MGRGPGRPGERLGTGARPAAGALALGSAAGLTGVGGVAEPKRGPGPWQTGSAGRVVPGRGGRGRIRVRGGARRPRTESGSAASREPRARRAVFRSQAGDPRSGGPSWAVRAIRNALPSAGPSLPARCGAPAQLPPPPRAESVLIPRLGPGGPAAASEAH